MEKGDKIFLAYNGQMGEETEKMTKERIKWILDMTGTGHHILDIGCSQGIITILAAENGNTAVGVDINEENIEFAKKLLHEKYSDSVAKVDFQCIDFYTWQSEEKYDVILLTEVIEHLEKPDVFLERVSQRMSETGKLIITVPFGVLNHPDHYSTFYVKGLYDLVDKYFDVSNITFVGKCLGVTAHTKGSLNKKFLLDEIIFQQEEKFFEKDKTQADRIEELYVKFCEVSEKYKSASKNYETAKEWHKNSLEKNSRLEKELSESKILYTETKGMLAVKEEECKSKTELCGQQQKLVEDLKNLGVQRESLIAEYASLNEHNKNRLDEVEAQLAKQTEEFSLETNRLSTSLMQEIEQKEKYFSELECCKSELKLCLTELTEKERTLEELKVCQTKISELHGQVEEAKEIQKKMKEMIMECADELQEQETFLTELRQYIRKLETQNKYLTSENAECRRKLAIITDTKLGQFCLKCYHLIKRIYRKLFGKK